MNELELALAILFDDGCPIHDAPEEEETDGGAISDADGEGDSSLNPKLIGTTTDGSIYHALADHQVNENWELQHLLHELQIWALRMNQEFHLRVPEIALSVEWLNRRRLGHFRYGHNGFGLRGEIAINRRHLAGRAFSQILGTLLHELLHAWQQAHGKPGKNNFHNKEFRAKAREFGLLIDERGHTGYESHSLFTQLLARYSINDTQLPPLPARQTDRLGTSKLKPWSCGCTRVWVAVADYQAICLKCSNKFGRRL